MEQQHDSVTCKRTIIIKAVVTESFKKLLALDTQQEMEEANRRMQQYEAECKNAIETIKSRTEGAVLVSKIKAQLDEEKQNFQSIMRQLQQRMEMIKAMAIDDLYEQGTVDGLATVRVGDNLYQKLSTMEIVVRDGIVERIFPTGIPVNMIK